MQTQQSYEQQQEGCPDFLEEEEGGVRQNRSEGSGNSGRVEESGSGHLDLNPYLWATQIAGMVGWMDGWICFRRDGVSKGHCYSYRYHHCCSLLCDAKQHQTFSSW